ncbi:MAG TPA: hypothetical protein DEO32_03170 [Ruminococcaceae bacterium]|nr:hypothetical protein [Oscillospiraceae bacterium]
MNDRILSFLGICKRAGKLASGADTVVKSVNSKKSRLVLYAADFSENSLKPVLRAAGENGVRVIKLDCSKQELSFALGRLSGVLSVDDPGFASKLVQMLDLQNR